MSLYNLTIADSSNNGETTSRSDGDNGDNNRETTSRSNGGQAIGKYGESRSDEGNNKEMTRRSDGGNNGEMTSRSDGGRRSIATRQSESFQSADSYPYDVYMINSAILLQYLLPV